MKNEEEKDGWVKLVTGLLDLHEFSAYFIPGLIFIYGLTLIYPQLGNFTLSNLNIVSFILLIILSYPAGHVLQATGDLIEKLLEYIPWFGDQKKKMEKKKFINLDRLTVIALEQEGNKIKIYKAHGKLRRGIAASILFLLIFGWLGVSLSGNTFYFYIAVSIIGVLVFFSMLWYMRRAEAREIKEVIKFGKVKR